MAGVTNNELTTLARMIKSGDAANAPLIVAILDERIFNKNELYKVYFLLNHYRPFKGAGKDAWDLHNKVMNAILQLEPWRDV